MASPELALVRELIELNWHTRSGEVDARRIAYDRAQEAFGDLGVPPGDVVRIGDCAAEWVRPVQRDGRVLLYLHGGSYALGSPQSHRHMSSALGAAGSDTHRYRPTRLGAACQTWRSARRYVQGPDGYGQRGPAIWSAGRVLAVTEPVKPVETSGYLCGLW